VGPSQTHRAIKITWKPMGMRAGHLHTGTVFRINSHNLSELDYRTSFSPALLVLVCLCRRGYRRRPSQLPYSRGRVEAGHFVWESPPQVSGYNSAKRAWYSGKVRLESEKCCTSTKATEPTKGREGCLLATTRINMEKRLVKSTKICCSFSPTFA